MVVADLERMRVLRCLLLCGVLALAGLSFAQEKGATDPAVSAFDKQSIALRTALHYDSSLQTPLDSLVSLYQKADRLDELIAVYQAHITQYPQDAGAHAVLIRILNKLQRPEAAELIQTTAQRLGDSPAIQYLLYEFLRDRRDDRALTALSAAIDLESDPIRRDAWLTELLEQAGEAKGRELATKHLLEIQKLPNQTAAGLLSLAGRMHEFGYDQPALETLALARAKAPSPEQEVDLDILRAKVLAAVGERAKAGEQLDQLLTRLAPDYWRRAEISGLRVSLLATEMDREDLLADAAAKYKQSSKDETLALNYAELLNASNERRKALEVLSKAAAEIPHSVKLEQEAIELYEQLGDEEGMAEFIESRIALNPDRADLIWRLVRIDYLRGNKEAAQENLSAALNALDTDEERGARLLELARFLRKNSLPDAAAESFRRVTEAVPERLDILREYAETLLALNDRSAVRERLDAPIQSGVVKDAPIESLIDLLDFMISENFLREARAALLARKEAEPNNFEIRLLLASVLGKVGEREQATSLLEETRDLADTTARYRDWLETNLAVAEIFDNAARFFDDEQVRLLTGAESEKDWTDERIDRFLAFCQIGERQDLNDQVTQVLRNQLEDPTLPSAVSVRLRSLLVKSLERRPEFAGEMEFHLKKLAEEDPSGANDYAMRRVLLYHSLQRSDLVKEALSQIEIEKVQGVKTLRAAYPVLLENNFVDAAKVALRQVTQREPEELINWDKRLSLLAAVGDEREFREALRELLGNATKAKLDARSLENLRNYLLDSYWRTIAEEVARGGPESVASALELLDSVERESVGPQDRLWSLWTRAWLLNSVGQKAGRDEAIEEIVSLGGETGRANPRIVFPDGLAIALSKAVDLLREPVEAEKEPTSSKSDGPLFDLALGWAFEVDAGARVVAIHPAGKEAVLVLDNLGKVYRVDRASGRLEWAEDFGLPKEAVAAESGSGTTGSGLQIRTGQFAISQQGSAITVQQLMAPYQTATLTGSGLSQQPVEVDVSHAKRVRSLHVSPDGSQFMLSFGPEIRSFDSQTGTLEWISDVRAHSGIEGMAAQGSVSSPDVHLQFVGDRVLCFAPAYGSVTAFDSGSGKLVWNRPMTDEEGLGSEEATFSLNTGADFGAKRSVVFGSESRIVDTASGETIWTFDGSDVRQFPMNLRKEAEEIVEKDVEEVVTVGKVASFRDHFSKEETDMKTFLDQPGALVAPTVAWSSARLRDRSASSAVIADERLLLMESEGFHEISLRLPLASKYHEVSGTFVGVVGEYAWFVERSEVVQVDMESGDVERFSAASISQDDASGVRAVLSGSRLYIVGNAGVMTLNAWSGSLLMQSPWPAGVTEYLTTHGGFSSVPGEQQQYVWQGIIKQIPNAPNYLFPIRDLVSDGWLFTMVNERSFVAIRSSETAPAAR